MEKAKLNADQIVKIGKDEFVVVHVSSKFDSDKPFDFLYELMSKSDYDRLIAAQEQPVDN